MTEREKRSQQIQEIGDKKQESHETSDRKALRLEMGNKRQVKQETEETRDRKAMR